VLATGPVARLVPRLVARQERLDARQEAVPEAGRSSTIVDRQMRCLPGEGKCRLGSHGTSPCGRI
jgi:hypothetical protein